MKQRILRLLFKLFGPLELYCEHSLETFNELSTPIINQLRIFPGVRIGSPGKVSGSDGEYWYSQTSFIFLSDKKHISVSWKLQDDGGEPYPVIHISYVLDRTVRNSGIEVFAVYGIYPNQIPQLIEILTKLIQNETRSILTPPSAGYTCSGCGEQPAAQGQRLCPNCSFRNS